MGEVPGSEESLREKREIGVMNGVDGGAEVGVMSKIDPTPPPETGKGTHRNV